ncbi:MAG: hypothetical protein ACRDWT_05180 [Jatrophihabitantaceae bacterium]
MRIDDQPVRGVSDIQAAIRNHRIGDQVRPTLTDRAGQQPRELRAAHQ